jgi:hypothetical protein
MGLAVISALSELMIRGFQDGRARKERMNLDLESLPESQTGTVRHKSSERIILCKELSGWGSSIVCLARD